MTKGNKSKEIAKYVLSLKPDVLSKEVINEVKRRIVDSIACAFGAYNSDVAKIVLKSSSKINSRYSAQLFGSKEKVFYEEAAFANGSLVRYLDFNDTYLSLEPAHPSDNIAPLIACAQAYKKSSMELILAIAVAYEIQCRLCDGASLRKYGIDHVTYGAFSTACGAAILMGLNKEELENAISIAGVCNISLRQTRTGNMSMWKACAFANAARQGLFAARLAKYGITGPSPIFEGTNGFEKLISGAINLELPPGNKCPNKILETYIKPYPVEYHAQSAVEAATSLFKKDIKINDIKELTIFTHRAAYEIIGSEKEKWEPDSKETADHSLPYCTAIALRDGNINNRSFTKQNFKNTHLIKFIKKIKLIEDKKYTKDYPNSFGNRIEVILKNNEKFTKEALYPLGHPKNRMNNEDLFKKFEILSAPFLKKSTINKQVEIIMKLEELKDLNNFFCIVK